MRPDLPGLIKTYKTSKKMSVIGFGVDQFAKLAVTYRNVFYYKTTYVGRYSYVYHPDEKPVNIA